MKEQTMEHRARYGWLDTLRGIWFISMLAYHTCYDLCAIFGIPMAWYTGRPGYVWQQSIAIGFVLMAGFSAVLSRRRERRGLIILGCGTLVSVVTALFMPDQIIWFGVLSLIGCGYLLAALLKKVLPQVPWGVGMGLSLLLFAVTKTLPQGYLSLGPLYLCELPDVLYSWPGMIFGFMPRVFFSADYVPLFPWVFLFFAGLFAGQGCAAKELPRGGAVPGLSLMGRHTLLLYLLHQPVIYGVLWLLMGR